MYQSIAPAIAQLRIPESSGNKTFSAKLSIGFRLSLILLANVKTTIRSRNAQSLILKWDISLVSINNVVGGEYSWFSPKSRRAAQTVPPVNALIVDSEKRSFSD